MEDGCSQIPECNVVTIDTWLLRLLPPTGVERKREASFIVENRLDGSFTEPIHNQVITPCLTFFCKVVQLSFHLMLHI